MRKSLLAGVMALGFTLMGNIAAHANPAFNGTWIMCCCERLILNNGNWTVQSRSNAERAWRDNARGTFTVRNDTIALHTTHIHRDNISIHPSITTGPELIDRDAARPHLVTYFTNQGGWRATHAGSSAGADSRVRSYFGGAIGSLWGTSALRLEAVYGRSPFSPDSVLSRQ